VGMRRQARELALQALYGLEVNPVDVRRFFADFWEEARGPVEARSFAEKLVRGVVENRKAIDGAIDATSKKWAMSRMAKVDLNILRIAAFELLFVVEIPKNVTINEAIDIARKYGSEDSPGFVNGILDEVASMVPDKPEQNSSEREEE
jgi:transcription antitermination protein NusB